MTELTRDQVVNAALVYKGTKWQHQGRASWGMDCVGLIISVAKDCGIDHGVAPHAYGRNPTGGTLRKLMDTELVRVYRKPKQGDIVMYKENNGEPRHVGIVTSIDPQLKIVHADTRTGTVHEEIVTDTLNNMHTCGTYSFKEFAT